MDDDRLISVVDPSGGVVITARIGIGTGMGDQRRVLTDRLPGLGGAG